MGNEEFSMIAITITSILCGLLLSLVVRGVDFVQAKTDDTFVCSLLFASGFIITIEFYLYTMFKLSEWGWL